MTVVAVITEQDVETARARHAEAVEELIARARDAGQVFFREAVHHELGRQRTG